MRDFWIFGAIKTRQTPQSTSHPVTLTILKKTGTSMIKFTKGNYAGREAQAKQNKTRTVGTYGIYDLTFVDNDQRISEADLKIDPNWIEIPNVKEYEAPNNNNIRPPKMPDKGDTIIVYWSMGETVYEATVLERCQDERYENWYKLRYKDGDVRWEDLGGISWWSTWEQSRAAFGLENKVLR